MLTQRAVVIFILAVLVGFAFGAPHLVIPRRLADRSRYTPLVVTDVTFPTRAALMAANGGGFERQRPELLEQFARWYVLYLLRPSEAELGAIVARYDALAPPADRPFGAYRADYVWMSPVEATKGRINFVAHPELAVVYRGRGVTIAKVAGR